MFSLLDNVLLMFLFFCCVEVLFYDGVMMLRLSFNESFNPLMCKQMILILVLLPFVLGSKFNAGLGIPRLLLVRFDVSPGFLHYTFLLVPHL